MKPIRIFTALSVIFSFMLLSGTTCLTEDEDKEDCTQNRKTVHGSAEMIVGQTAMWSFNTADQNGGIKDANKRCHADMLLEFRFKNDSLAKLWVKPPILYSFNGGGALFPTNTYYTGNSVDQDGRVTWRVTCNMAAKNAPENPVSFGVIVEWDLNQSLDWHNVIIYATIDYQMYTF